MNTTELTRRGALGLIGSAPMLLAMRANAEDAVGFASALEREPRLLGFATVQAQELQASLITIHGRLPIGIKGVLWRNGPAEHERFGHRYRHWFDSDGMVQAFAFSGTAVTHRGRLLSTPKRARETRAGRRIMPAFGTLPPELAAPRNGDDMNVANTHIIVHGGRLLALWEGGSALEVDPETLESGRLIEWRSDLAGAPFSAHPKIEPGGTLWNFGYSLAPRPVLLFYRIGPSGHLAAANTLPVSPLGLTHDFIVTRKHVVLLLTPFVFEPERFLAGEQSFLDAHAWQPALGTRVLAIDKNTLEVARRYELPAGFHFHHGNGWEEKDGTIRLDLCQAPDPQFLTRDLRHVMQGTWSFPSAPPAYRCVTLRPNGTAEIGEAEPGAAEFPRIDARYTGHRHRMVFALTGIHADHAWPLEKIARLEPGSGAVDDWAFPASQIPEEHVFVPRGGSEGDGWLVGTFLDTKRQVSGLSVFDAGNLANGPIWQGILPYPLPLGLHGTFQMA